jgi:hypothetical protein
MKKNINLRLKTGMAVKSLLKGFFKVLPHVVFGLILFAFLHLVLGMLTVAHGKTIYYGTSVETITIVHGGPTIFRFNEQVKTISRASKFSISPSDKESPDYTTLSVTPRFSKGSSKVTFLLADGAVVSTKIVIVPKNIPEKNDNFYDFLPKEKLIEKKKESNVTDLDLMKAMLRWENVVGYKTKTFYRTVNSGSKQLSAKIIRVYTGPKFNGYVVKVTNKSKKKSYQIDLKSLSIGNPNQAILSQVDRKVLGPKGSGNETTYLRVVAKSTSVYYGINLPVGPANQK